MIAATLLEALREKDPATYIKYSHIPNAHLLAGTPVMDAWLQAVLQEATHQRDWSMKIEEEGMPLKLPYNKKDI